MSNHFSGYGRFIPSYGGMFRHQHSPHYHGFCPHCCHPMALCCCGFRECIKVPKEVTISPYAQYPGYGVFGYGALTSPVSTDFSTTASDAEKKAKEGVPTKEAAGVEIKSEKKLAEEIRKAGFFPPVDPNAPPNAIIGGGCCVHLSIEIIPTMMGAGGGVSITVVDSDFTILTWEKLEASSFSYYIKEGIITTKPGARLYGQVFYVIARVRWCEVFSG